MLLVHEDDQDLILGQAAPLSISTHPTNAIAAPHQGDANAPPPALPCRASAACQLLNWFFSDAAVLHSALCLFKMEYNLNQVSF